MATSRPALMANKAVIFDFDDTLVNTRLVKWQQHQTVAREVYGINLTDEVLKQHWGKPYDETLRQYYRDADTIENMRAAKLRYEDQFPVTVAEGAIDTINQLLQMGVAVGVLTSSRRELVLADLSRLGFPVDSLAYVQASDETAVHKPDPHVFMPILRHLKGMQAHEVWYVGDDIRDLQAAQGAGLAFIGVTSGLTTHEQFKKSGAAYIINQLRQAVDIIIKPEPLDA